MAIAHSNAVSAFGLPAMWCRYPNQSGGPNHHLQGPYMKAAQQRAAHSGVHSSNMSNSKHSTSYRVEQQLELATVQTLMIAGTVCVLVKSHPNRVPNRHLHRNSRYQHSAQITQQCATEAQRSMKHEAWYHCSAC